MPQKSQFPDLPAFSADDFRVAIREVETSEKASIEIEKDKPKPSRNAGVRRPPYGYAFQEIKNLVWAKKHPVLSVALDEWDRKERLVSSRVDRREKRSADLISQIFNIVGFYSVYQGVVLTAVTQLVSAGKDCGSQCGKVWFPILLTGVGAVVTIIGCLEKFTTLKKLEKSIKEERRVQGVRCLCFSSTDFWLLFHRDGSILRKVFLCVICCLVIISFDYATH